MSDLAEAFVVPSEQLEAAWPTIAKFVSRVTDLPWSLDDVRTELAQARAQVFGIREGTEVLGIVITRIENTPSHRYGVIWIAAGSGLAAGFRMLERQIEPWLFDEMGCEWIELQGRRGWSRMLSNYQEAAVVLRKYAVQRD